MAHDLIDQRNQAVLNISRYQTELKENPGLAALMKQVHAWYAVRTDDSAWLFAPSMFVGYAENTAETYLSRRYVRDGGRTEAILKRWFDVVPPSSRRRTELDSALRQFLNEYGHSGPRKGARVCVLKEILGGGAGPEVQDRVHIDPAICGGRPHIRGTRVRVSDILDLLASGVRSSEILADYPYLSDADVRAALAFGAAASGHRVILAA